MSNQNAIPTGQDVVKYLDGLPAEKLVADKKVADKFISLFNKVHGTDMGELAYQAEQFYFQKLLAEKKELAACTKISLYGAFIDVAVQGLSFDPMKKLCYVIPQPVNVGTKDNKVWETRAVLHISPYGELALRQRCGQIKYADNPEVVIDGEDFSVQSTAQGKLVLHTIRYPRPVGRIVAAYIRLVRPDGSTDYFIIDQGKMDQLKAASAKKNKGTANELYTSGEGGGPDRGFIVGKCVKHAFSAFPKVRPAGAFSKLETEDIINEEEEDIDYGLANTSAQPTIAAPVPEIKTDEQPVVVVAELKKEQPNPQPVVVPVTESQDINTEVQASVDPELGF